MVEAFLKRFPPGTCKPFSMTTDPLSHLTPRTTSEVIDQYMKLGWTFKQVSWPRTGGGKSASGDEGHGVEVAYTYTSPRLEGGSGFLPDGFTEDALLRDESELRVRRDHAAAIYAATREATNGVVRELGVLYRLRDRGKIVSIPESVTIKDVVVRLTP
jgi:hypothetical protein